MLTTAPSRVRCLAVWSGVVAAVAVTVAWVLPDLHDAWQHVTGDPVALVPFAQWLTWLCAVALAGCALWAGWVASVVVLEALRGTPGRPAGRPAPRGVPAWSRRLVLTACGAAVVAVVPAGAHAEDPGPSGLHGLPLPERAQAGSVTDLVGGLLLTSASPGSSRPTPVGPPPRPGPLAARATSAGATHVVVPGESLWTVAASVLEADAAPGEAVGADEVAAYWPRLHAANRTAVGPDPDLISPGQRLVLPPTTDHPREDLR